MKLNVVVTQGNESQNQTLALPVASCIMGRGAADLKMSDGHCSNQHAVVALLPDGTVWLTDMGSFEGTLICANGSKGSKYSPATAL